MTNRLGPYLKDRRSKLDPTALGFAPGRRRTPGLRREEVASRANVSTTWYTWLEQGRGGAPSADVLERIARALMLTDAEREHMFLIGLGRAPDVRYRPIEGITPRLQRILDAFTVSPAIIRTLTWDVVAWNRAAAAVLGDYSKLGPQQRNILRLMFSQPSQVREMQFDFHSVARFVVAAFRADVARAGAEEHVQVLIDELSRSSADFAALWRENDVAAGQHEGVKRLKHPKLGELQLDYSAFGIEGRPDLTMVVYNPAGAETATKVRKLITALKA